LDGNGDALWSAYHGYSDCSDALAGKWKIEVAFFMHGRTGINFDNCPIIGFLLASASRAVTVVQQSSIAEANCTD
jgi:hypothetical protein